MGSQSGEILDILPDIALLGLIPDGSFVVQLLVMLGAGSQCLLEAAGRGVNRLVDGRANSTLPR